MRTWGALLCWILASWLLSAASFNQHLSSRGTGREGPRLGTVASHLTSGPRRLHLRGGGDEDVREEREMEGGGGADFEASDEDMFDDRTVEISKCVMDLTAHARKRTEVDSENANMAGKYLDIHVGQSASAEDLKEKMVHQLNGTLLVPVHFNTLAQALASCPSGGKIALQADNYNLSLYRVIVPEAVLLLTLPLLLPLLLLSASLLSPSSFEL
ncbi:hypothetical protein GUITHDRAFT_151913 [Guillardia theta CCMP2712]|uniref:Uncharacterized protein n=1 Tax=Guillardia theta (strain CCMP2712) TaxID=905079 RepID=L1JHQ7_GUITC|nr:hypothetical protein GUITHDRAFT_151913 [Guillardia theta CCMP2712]EKX48031.1 hypothetical protein GUITHDRAFT_151913 [Guillardia theta CCMP2712]|eukprot:XP_005835011.1 hypothetical protein GUITHDRAFT_151913 [Guillardia theta CCMP2712]